MVEEERESAGIKLVGSGPNDSVKKRGWEVQSNGRLRADSFPPSLIQILVTLLQSEGLVSYIIP